MSAYNTDFLHGKGIQRISDWRCNRLCQETDQDSQEYIAWRLSFGTHVPGTS